MLSREIVNSGLFTRGGQWLTKSRLTWGCLGLIGTSTLGSVVVLEVQDKKISGLLSKIGDAIGNKSSRSSEAPSEQSEESNLSNQINGFITDTLWGAVTSVFSTSWEGVKSSVMWVVDLFSKNSEETGELKAKELGKGILQFLKNFFSAKFFYNFFNNFFSKFFNFVQLIADSEIRTNLFKLFKPEQWDKTLDLIKLFLGLNVFSKRITADPTIFNLLLPQLLDKPKDVIRKFESLSKSINQLTTSIKGGGTGGQGIATDPEKNKKYEIKIEDLMEYLSLPEGVLEKVYETIWMVEISTKIKTGVDFTWGSKLAVAEASMIFNSWLPTITPFKSF